MVPWWGQVSSAAAPVFLIGGWTVAATRQPSGFDSTVNSISSLAAVGAADRWLMTSALVATGVCHLLTAGALRPVRWWGRALIALGGVGTLLVAAAPLPVEGGSTPHRFAAATAFVALAAWPAAAGPALPVRARVGAAVVLLGLVAWFGVELGAQSERVGLAERVAAGAQTIWPFLVVSALRSSRFGGSPHVS
jgi:hypothetical membrane protein